MAVFVTGYKGKFCASGKKTIRNPLKNKPNLFSAVKNKMIHIYFP